MTMEEKMIAVVMGGPSSEAEISRRTGQAVVEALQAKGHRVVGVEFDPLRFVRDIEALKPAVVFNAMHGAFGEDGRLAAVLEVLGIPYTGSGVLAGALTLNKAANKRVLLGAGIPTPSARMYRSYERARDLAGEIAEGFSLPVVVKAAAQGSSLGVVIAAQEEDLPGALEEAFRYDDEVVVEAFIDGVEITVAVMGDGVKNEVFPIIEITTVSGRYDYESKYTKGASQHIIPARLAPETAEKARDIALAAFSVCGCRGVARMDMMVSKEGQPYVIDINTMPGMTETSLVPDAARAMGMDFPTLCERLLLLSGVKV
ncbi:MAG: D-alanine--D-alanine ligase family protein [Schwartzia sp. (in: firmicutes)]